jgi:hypothetical protein
MVPLFPGQELENPAGFNVLHLLGGQPVKIHGVLFGLYGTPNCFLNGNGIEVHKFLLLIYFILYRCAGANANFLILPALVITGKL